MGIIKIVVKLLYWLNNYINPLNNDGRPVIMVPLSNCVEFTVVS